MLDLMEAMTRRHSVRAYQNRPLDAEVQQQLEKGIEKVNRQSGFHFQLITNEPKAFSSRLAKYGHFENVTSYVLVIGPKDADEAAGYYGEEIVLLAQQLGLNSCWVGLTYKKVAGTYSLLPGEKIYAAIALGYGKSNGVPHKSKPIESLSNLNPQSPDWFKKGVEAALLAPTAVNQQKFHFELQNDKVLATSKRSPYAKLDLGIAKYHFEKGADKDSTIWK